MRLILDAEKGNSGTGGSGHIQFGSRISSAVFRFRGNALRSGPGTQRHCRHHHTPSAIVTSLHYSDSQSDSHRGRTAAIPISARSRFPPFVRLDGVFALCCSFLSCSRLRSCDGGSALQLRLYANQPPLSDLQRLQRRLTYEAYMHPKRATRTMLCSFKITFGRCLAAFRKRRQASPLGLLAAFSRAAPKPLVNRILNTLCIRCLFRWNRRSVPRRIGRS